MTRVAVVGGGQMARKVYLPVLAARPDVELAALVEPDDERRRQLNRAYRFGKAVASVADLAAGDADCAFLLTPAPVRREPASALLEMGCDILCEKPLAQSLADAEALTRLAEGTGRILMVGFNHRFMPVYRKAKQLLAGDPAAIECGGEPPGRRIDLCRVQKQGADLVNHTIHVLDILRFFCGEAVEVRAAGNFEGSKETVAAALIRFEGGTLGVFQTYHAVGIRLEELEAHGAGFSLYVEAPHRAVMCENGQTTTYRPGQDTWYVQSEDLYGFTDEIDHFLEAVRTRRTPESSAAEAVKSLRLALDILTKMKGD